MLSPASSVISTVPALRKATAAPRNAYDEFIHQHNDPAALARAYDEHRRTRNANSRATLLAAGAVKPDPILIGLEIEHEPPEFDPRNCVSLWCRPTAQVTGLVQQVQERLREADPAIWLMPSNCLHMTSLEVVHSAGVDVVVEAARKMKPYLDTLLGPRPAPVLVKPILSFDQNALALSFLPEVTSSQSAANGAVDEYVDWYTYHHYRSDLHDIVQTYAGVTVNCRYTYPSAHITIARFTQPLTPTMQTWIEKLEDINAWLEADGAADIRWVIGDERGTECRCGRVWYGGGWAEGIGLTLQQAQASEELEKVWRTHVSPSAV
ncbi:RNA ligase/cyclic nucleotide phosphodiesterase [Limtongia smithiae]|uniref:RNA ligase/cyclic nucleotide phosphodiesterase n=1 Tax=Limtongia smithiae TaxID=1125753 RepID=UPI0034CD43F5